MAKNSTKKNGKYHGCAFGFYNVHGTDLLVIMFPKIIHYCWFGRNPLPKSAMRCISSWREFFPDFEIQEWNEDNFDINMTPYTKEAYEAKKYAFVSDFARYWILFNYGGVYFDTDVEVIKSFYSILKKGAFFGREAGTDGKVAPGLGMAVSAGHGFYKEVLEYYSGIHFFNEDSSFNQTTIVNYTTDLLMNYGLIREDVFQQIDGINIFPSDYFCPMDSTTGIIKKTNNTVSIHHYDCSWLNHYTFRFQIHLIKNRINRLLGTKF